MDGSVSDPKPLLRPVVSNTKLYQKRSDGPRDKPVDTPDLWSYVARASVLIQIHGTL